MGYFQAAADLGLPIEITGVDINPQPNYPFAFIQADAIEFCQGERLSTFTHIHASPPCQLYSAAAATRRKQGYEYPDLYTPIKPILYSSGRPAIIENVPGSPIRPDVVLTGPMFGLRVIRERWFECVNFFMLAPSVPAVRDGAIKKHGEFVTVVGNGCFKSGKKNGVRYAGPGKTVVEAWSLAMGIDWMTKKELTQAIPPAYTRFLGNEFFKR